MKNNVNEAQIRNIVSESVKKVLNEVEWRTAAKAAAKSNNLVNFTHTGGQSDLADAFDEFNMKASIIEDWLSDFNNQYADDLSYELEDIVIKIGKFVKRKENQMINLSRHAYDKYAKTHNGKDLANVYDDEDYDGDIPERF